LIALSQRVVVAGGVSVMLAKYSTKYCPMPQPLDACQLPWAVAWSERS
jgi:hypothetical protein